MPTDDPAAPRVPRMDPVHARAWRALVAVGEQLPTRLDAQLTNDAGIINVEYAILGALVSAPGSTLRMGALAERSLFSTPRTSKAVTRLQKRGLVERISCAGDGRAINVHLTREGLRTYLRATPPHIELARDTILGDLTDEELTTLADLLDRVIPRLGTD
ncbi:MarR family transcriptional regulator [Brachybacterium sp. J144]|uniref:MarR family winged helix-turn-helix transcriptional regulator n=1 Tax=Brachybacterium sp. J144 TaxID=3116487 RepID=UPI002E784CB9|nr:MarR family transcriptional regulator [Brachybacterium sp. J144]MEE1650426.1 MarR family transcriptional regulator [Brachybacterium sp. J144]